MRIALIAKLGHENTGVGRYTGQLRAALEALENEVIMVYPTCPFPEWLVRGIRRRLGWDLGEFFNNYPVWARYPQADIYHLTSQNLATLLLFRQPPGKTVVTVHDLIPWLARNDPALRIYEHRLAEWFDRLSLAGLRRADGLLAVSAFTQRSLSRADVAAKEATVVMESVE